jgi:hypothetical protein
MYAKISLGGFEIVTQDNGPTCKAEKWCRMLTAHNLDSDGNGLRIF